MSTTIHHASRKEDMAWYSSIHPCLPAGGDRKSVDLWRKYTPLSTKYIYIKSTTVYVPLSELGLSQSQPLSRHLVCPSASPQKRGGGSAHSPAGAGLGESQFRLPGEKA